MNDCAPRDSEIRKIKEVSLEEKKAGELTTNDIEIFLYDQPQRGGSR